MSKLPIFEHFLSVGNLKPKLKWFFKLKLEPNFLLLNWVPDIDKTDKQGQTPLYWAARIGHTDVVRMLLDAGADPNKRNIRGESPLDGPVGIGDMDVALLLLDAGARPKQGFNCKII